jgi:hypothetical protein
VVARLAVGCLAVVVVVVVVAAVVIRDEWL